MSAETASPVVKPAEKTSFKTVQGVEIEKIKWVTEEEAEKFGKLLTRQFVKKDDLFDAKKFFYRIIGIRPYQPGIAAFIEGALSTEQQLYQFELQKYHRNKTITVTRRDNKQNTVEVQDNMPVVAHEMNPRTGTWRRVSDDADPVVDSRKFLELYKIDDQE